MSFSSCLISDTNGIVIITISEDFSFMLREAPGCYILVGNGAGCGCGSVALHKPTWHKDIFRKSAFVN